MSDSPDLGQTPIAYPQSFVNTLALSNGDADLKGSDAGEGPVSPSSQESPEQLGKEELGEREEYYFGIGPWHPKWLQVLRNAKFFTLILCLNCFIEGALVSGFTSVVLSSLERRYRFSSLAAGFIAASFDVAVLFSVIFISYFGGKGHKPRWLGISLIIQGIGAFVFALPKPIFGNYEAGQRGGLTFEACGDGLDYSTDCNSANGLALAFFIIGELIIGVGAASLFTIGTSYLDDIIHPKRVSIHLGIFYTLLVVGPALGYGLGGAFLSVYVDIGVSTHLSPSDPGWVGAWWLCFVFAGVVSMLISIPFLMFPRLLPDSHLVKKARMEEMAKTYQSKFGEKEDSVLTNKLKSFPVHVKQVLTNPAWLFITLGIAGSFLVLVGLVTFAPKYLESQFGLNPSSAALVAGGVAIPSGGLGVLTGALVMFCSKMKGRKVVLYSTIVSFIAIFPTLAFLVHCPTLELAGVNVRYPDGVLNSDLNSTCTFPCNCTSTIFEPVCGADEVNYFSPCRAGCDKILQDEDSDPIFENCTCVVSSLEMEQGGNVSVAGSASDGQCDSNCNNLGLFLFLLAVSLFLIFMLNIPNVIITIRCVAEEQRTLALGAQSLVFRAFGSIPGPILFGVIFDSACIYWQNECGRRGNCWVYDNFKLSRRAEGLAISGLIIFSFFSFLCWLVYPRDTPGEGKGREKEGGESGNLYSNEGVEDSIKKEGIELNPVLSRASQSGDGYPSEATEDSVTERVAVLNPVVGAVSKDLLLEEGSDAENENEDDRSLSCDSATNERGENEISSSGVELDDVLASIVSGDRLLQSLDGIDGGAAETTVDSD